MSEPKPNAAVIVAFDPPDTGGTRQMSKMLAGSLTRTFFAGPVLVFRNGATPLYLVERAGVVETVVETPELKQGALRDQAHRWVAGQAEKEFDAGSFAWVLCLPADCLALRNLDHLLDADAEADVLVERLDREAGTSGKPVAVWAVRGEHFSQVMALWKKEMEAVANGAAAWGQVVEKLARGDMGLRVREFERHEIQYPFQKDKDWLLYKDAALLHMSGAGQAEKIEFLFGMYMQKFYGDAAITFLNIIEV